jgi:hypothetical protein
MHSNSTVTIRPDRLWRFLLAWILANGVAPTVFIALVLTSLFVSDTLGNDDLGASLGLAGFALFFLLLGVGNWMFMRRRGHSPAAWGTMTFLGAGCGSVALSFIAVHGPELIQPWIFSTADDLIDSPLPPSEITALIAVAAAGLSFGAAVGVCQAIVLRLSIWARLGWLTISVLATMFAFGIGYAIDTAYGDIAVVTGSRETLGVTWGWLLVVITTFFLTLIYAVPTGIALWRLLQRAARSYSESLLRRFD